MVRRTRRDPRELIILLVLFGVFIGGWQLKRTQSSMIRASVTPGKAVLRVLAPDQERVTATISPYGPGFERELVESFAHGAGYRVQWLSCDDPGEALALLSQKRADLYIGPGELPVPPAQEIGQTLGGHANLAAGPAYAHYRPLLVEAGLQDEPAHGGRHVLLHASLDVQNIHSGLGNVSQLQQASLTRVPQRIGFSALLNSLHARTAPMAVLADDRFRLWQPFYLQLRPATTLPEEIPWRWFWRTDNRRFAMAMQSFWSYHETETRLAELTERYFGFFPGETPYYELENLYSTLESELPKYAPAIAKHTGEHGVNPLLFVAMVYQESAFDPRAKSYTGAKGLLQFTSTAADYFGLDDRYDPLASIKAGSAYLAMQYERLEDLDLAPWDRWCFALAAYNQGMGGLRDAIDLAKRLGMSGRTWRELKTVFPLLEQKRYARLAKHGTCRGSEAVQYVDKVRYYFYILNGIVRLSRPEAQHLGPLLDGLVGGSFAGDVAAPASGPLS